MSFIAPRRSATLVNCALETLLLTYWLITSNLVNVHKTVEHYVKERQIEHPEDGEYDSVPLISGNHGNERQQGSAETEEVHAGLDVEADAWQQTKKRRLTSNEIMKRLRVYTAVKWQLNVVNPLTPTVAMWSSASECPGVKNYIWRLNPVWHRMLYSFTHNGSSLRQRVNW